MKDDLLEVGDELYCLGRYNNKAMYYAGKITRVTPTLAFIDDTKLRRVYRGYTVVPGTGGYNQTFYYLIDDEKRSEVMRQHKRRTLMKPLQDIIRGGDKSLSNLTDSQLERINAILAEPMIESKVRK